MIITLTIHNEKKTSDVVPCEVNIEHCGTNRIETKVVGELHRKQRLAGCMTVIES